jgi:hypothetical protein
MAEHLGFAAAVGNEVEFCLKLLPHRWYHIHLIYIYCTHIYILGYAMCLHQFVSTLALSWVSLLSILTQKIRIMIIIAIICYYYFTYIYIHMYMYIYVYIYIYTEYIYTDYIYTDYIGRGSCLISIGTFSAGWKAWAPNGAAVPLQISRAWLSSRTSRAQPGSEWGERGITYVNQPWLGIGILTHWIFLSTIIGH